jgi:8-amino-7-oxononanoate synthase
MTIELEQRLTELAGQGRLRRLAAREGRDFSSNDYLGLAESSELRAAALAALDRGVPLGAGASRLLRGNHREHEALEAEAATFFRAEAALYFATGFSANYALFSTLPQRGDLVVHDELIHASVHDGLRNGRAERRAVPHNDAQAFDGAIRHWRAAGGRGRPWIAVESLYSMDGDIAPLEDLARIARAHEAVLVIDEAHATGVLGEAGRGLGWRLEGQENVISLHTCGKALGGSGALVCASRTVRDFLVNRGRAFVFSTAPSPLAAAVVRAALRLVGEVPDRRQRHARLVAHANAKLARHCGMPASGTHIVPVILGANERAVAVAAAAQAAGFDVRAVRPPTVPDGTARLRLSITLNVDEHVVDELACVLGSLLAQAGEAP